jgi:hypothetical protein
MLFCMSRATSSKAKQKWSGQECAAIGAWAAVWPIRYNHDDVSNEASACFLPCPCPSNISSVLYFVSHVLCVSVVELQSVMGFV